MIRESIKELAKTAHTLTVEQWDNLTLNTYERNFLYEYLPNEVLLKTCRQHNLNVLVVAHPTTYNEAVVAILFPELIRRLEQELTSKNEKYNKLKTRVEYFLKSTSWTRYKETARSITLETVNENIVQCGTIPFKELEQAITNDE